MTPCRVCNLPLAHDDAAFDPEVSYTDWPVVEWPYLVHRDCVPRAAREMVERLQREGTANGRPQVLPPAL